MLGRYAFTPSQPEAALRPLRDPQAADPDEEETGENGTCPRAPPGARHWRDAVRLHAGPDRINAHRGAERAMRSRTEARYWHRQFDAPSSGPDRCCRARSSNDSRGDAVGEAGQAGN
ncbi:hypothetical protein GCM10010430_53400 [Kitasatospora cystarginea]|uniref:Uncharacterized protein n=1 Tax=Kitasatospora cystarginea TaxID=58350 RepID=A0ABP5RJY2_9ACTN